jgi:hypothetical protein
MVSNEADVAGPVCHRRLSEPADVGEEAKKKPIEITILKKID